MDSAVLPFAYLDSIEIYPTATRGHRQVGKVASPHGHDVVADLLDTIGWREVLGVAEAVRDRRGLGMDWRGFRYPTDELDPGEERFNGVEIYTPLGEVHVDPEGFHRLMARFFTALIEGVTALDHSARREPWWPTFVELAAQISARAAAR